MRKFIAAFIVNFILCSTAAATTQVILAGGVADNLGTIYNTVMGSCDLSTDESTVVQVIPTAGTFKNLRVVAEAAPGTSNSFTVTFRKSTSPNDHTTLADTSLTTTISNSATTNSDTTNTVSVSAGDIVTYSIVQGGTPADTELGLAVEFEPTTAGETIFLAVNQASGTATRYAPIMSQSMANDQDAIDTTMVMPTTGVFKKLYAYMPTAPTPGQWTATLYNDTDAADSSLACAVTTGNQACNDTSNTYTITVAGSLLAHKMGPASSPGASVVARGMVFVPDTSGDFIIAGQTNDLANNNEYIQAVHAENTVAGQWTSTTFGESLSGMSGLSSSGTVKEFWAYTDRAPGTAASGKAVTYTLNKYNNGTPSDTSATVTYTDTEEGVKSVTGLSVNIPDNEGVRWKATLTNTPTVPETKFSLLANIPTAGGGGARRMFVSQ